MFVGHWRGGGAVQCCTCDLLSLLTTPTHQLTAGTWRRRSIHAAGQRIWLSCAQHSRLANHLTASSTSLRYGISLCLQTKMNTSCRVPREYPYLFLNKSKIYSQIAWKSILMMLGKYQFCFRTGNEVRSWQWQHSREINSFSVLLQWLLFKQFDGPLNFKSPFNRLIINM